MIEIIQKILDDVNHDHFFFNKIKTVKGVLLVDVVVGIDGDILSLYNVNLKYDLKTSKVIKNNIKIKRKVNSSACGTFYKINMLEESNTFDYNIIYKTSEKNDKEISILVDRFLSTASRVLKSEKSNINDIDFRHYDMCKYLQDVLPNGINVFALTSRTDIYSNEFARVIRADEYSFEVECFFIRGYGTEYIRHFTDIIEYNKKVKSYNDYYNNKKFNYDSIGRIVTLEDYNEINKFSD